MVNFHQNPPALDGTFHALADPTRRAILSGLAGGARTVSEIAEPFDMSLPAISKHLTVLEKAGLIERERVGRTRLCRLAARPMKDAADWIEAYREFWEKRLDELAKHLSESKNPPANEANKEK